jgi:hypothetical protein
MDKRQLRVEMDELLDAFEERSEHVVMYFNRETGEVGTWIDPDFNEWPQLDPDDACWVEIPRLDARDGIREIERFVDTLDELDVQRQLRNAIQGKGAFRRFRETLHGYPDLRARWEVAHRDYLLQQALGFLAELGIEPLYELRRPVAEPAPASQPKHPRIGLHHLLLLGSPNGKTELIEGRVNRCIRLRSPQQARKQFEHLAREIMELHGLAWRRSAVDGRDTLELDPFHLRIDGNCVLVATAVPRPIWDAFA